MTLNEWMTLKGMKDEELAAQIKAETGESVSRSQINRIRRGRSNPRPKIARALEQVTKISAAAFVLGEAGERRAA